MKITEALQAEGSQVRLSNGNRWLVGNGEGGWIVYGRKPFARHTKILIETSTEDLAVKILLSED